MTALLIETNNISVMTNENRMLVQDLNMCLAKERVAVIGRNGVGKSTLLKVLAGHETPHCGEVVLYTQPCFVKQHLNPQRGNPDVEETLEQLQLFDSSLLQREFSLAGLRSPEQMFRQLAFSHGEFRKLLLLLAKLSLPSLLILDEPTQDLDECGIAWLREWLEVWPNGLIVASHDSLLLQDFRDFFIVSETGCRHFPGSFAQLAKELEDEHNASQKRYLRNINILVEQQEHIDYIARRRGRKKRYGRVSELDRATPRQRLNQKRDYAQFKHGRMKKIRDARLKAVREWTKETRRMLDVKLPLQLSAPQLPLDDGAVLITLEKVAFSLAERNLFQRIDLQQRRERLAVVGANGTGKTTLLQIMLGEKMPSVGLAKREKSRIGYISQGGTNWMLEDSLLEYLSLHSEIDSQEDLAKLLIVHKFPLALAQRPMSSLSPGERVRAALICLFQRSPVVELLVLDEPTYSLDLVGLRALTNALKAWPGGLVIASHRQGFLQEIGVNRFLKLD